MIKGIFTIFKLLVSGILLGSVLSCNSGKQESQDETSPNMSFSRKLDEGWVFVPGRLLVDESRIENGQNPEESSIQPAGLKRKLGCRIDSKKRELINERCKGFRIRGQDLPFLLENPNAFYPIRVPHKWDENPENIPGLEAQGYGVYRWQGELPPGRLALLEKRTLTYSSARIWIRDGNTLKLIYHSGVPGVSPEESLDILRGIYTELDSRGGEVSLYIEVSNWMVRRGSLSNTLEVGLAENVKHSKNQYYWGRVFVAGILFMAGFYHLLLYVLKPNIAMTFWFGIFSLFLAVRTLIMSKILTEILLYSDINSLILKIEYLTMTIPGFLFLHYMYHLYRRSFRYGIVLGVTVYCIALSLFVVVTPSTIFTKQLTLLQTGPMISIVAVLYILIRSYFLEDRYIRRVNRNIVLVLLIYISAMIHDILMYQGFFQSIDLSEIGLVFFVLGQGLVIAQVNSDAWSSSETLAKDLAEEIRVRKDLQVSKEEVEKKKLTVDKELEEANLQLIQAEKLASLGAMVSGIAHEIANPVSFATVSTQNLNRYLTGFQASLTEMADGDEDALQTFDSEFEKSRSFLQEIQFGLEKVKEINQSMRNAARSDAEKTKGVHLADVVEEAILILGSKLKNIQIIRKFPEDFPTITCQRSQIGQVVMNFVSNSCDAIEEYAESLSDPNDYQGKISIQLVESPNKTKVGIAVSDNAGGVPFEIRDKILEVFYTTKPAGKGTGLGLAICGKIATNHNGRIEIGEGLKREDGGKGARFVLVVAKE